MKYITNIIKDNEGITYPVFGIYMILLIMSFIYAVFGGGMYNPVIDEFNELIDDGTVSEDTAKVMDWMVTMYRTIPLFVVLIAFIFTIVTAVRERRVGGAYS